MNLSFKELESCFPFEKYEAMRDNQVAAFETISQGGFRHLLELPTGSGKNDIGGPFLRALKKKRAFGALFYITPTKTLVNQFQQFYPEAHVVYGRSEYPCLYYQNRNKEVNAADCPCFLLDCKHRVDKNTGSVQEPGLEACPYLYAKWRAGQGGIVVCTTAFFLVNKLCQDFPSKISGLVIDEAHKIAETARQVFQYDITDWNLKRLAQMLDPKLDDKLIGQFDGYRISADNLRPLVCAEAFQLIYFRRVLIKIAKTKPERTPALLAQSEINKLMSSLRQINLKQAEARVRQDMADGTIDTVASQENLKLLEDVSLNIRKYLSSFHFALKEEKRNALNYIFAFCRKERKGKEKANHILCIRGHYVAPLIRKAIAKIGNVLAYSATIGKSQVFGFETGLDQKIAGFKFRTFPSEFPVKNTKIFMPTDVPSLAFKQVRENGQLKNRAMALVIDGVVRGKESDYRSLIIVISNLERDEFTQACENSNLNPISYGNGVPARAAVDKFKNGDGDALIGTAASCGQGIDLPKLIAPIIFFWRPGYDNPNDPASQFERDRFSNQYWALQNWRVMQKLLQVRGRNVRNPDDLGFTILVSKQFEAFAETALPEWLLPAYVKDKTFEECVSEVVNILSSI